MATNRPRYMISVDNDMFKEIEDFRFENRFPTRSAATTVLIRKGLDALNSQNKEKNAKKGHSAE
jgi:metal-responsive CopG/Arc/MetJ family transcriptional regulator